MDLTAPLRSGLKRTASYARERRLRLPSPAFQLSPSRRKARTPEQLQLVRQLRRDGIVKLPWRVDPETLADMQAGFERMSASAEAKRSGASEAAIRQARRESQYDDSGSCAYDEEYESFVCNDPLMFSYGLARFAMSDELLSIINSYYRRQALLSRSIAMRFYPKERPRGVFGWAWHHDGWGRKVNAMVLLTEVGDEDQCMTFKKGTHVFYHGLDTMSERTLTDEQVERDLAGYETVRATGRPGDVWVFDTNAWHSANSANTRTRDVFVLMYYCDRTFMFGQTVPEPAIRESNPEDLRVYKETLRFNEFRKRHGIDSIRPTKGVQWQDTLRPLRDWLL